MNNSNATAAPMINSQNFESREIVVTSQYDETKTEDYTSFGWKVIGVKIPTATDDPSILYTLVVRRDLKLPNLSKLTELEVTYEQLHSAILNVPLPLQLQQLHSFDGKVTMGQVLKSDILRGISSMGFNAANNFTLGLYSKAQRAKQMNAINEQQKVKEEVQRQVDIYNKTIQKLLSQANTIVWFARTLLPKGYNEYHFQKQTVKSFASKEFALQLFGK
ncbi:hypothetical protein [[Mycoplasma] testudinis]|uniref:hypothetical protein n=1 Tax=[Mycoplasma] testudinis TaxID=33924 RepID=UPI000A03E592|nr:hypothetical protein [[Mycoplasma] testudinis]